VFAPQIVLSWNLAAVAVMMFGGWIVSLAIRNVTIVDSLWGLGFILIAVLTGFMSDGYWVRNLLIVCLVSLWGLRLSIYLTWRNWGKGEDPRYGGWREKSGNRFWFVSLFKVFILQALFMWVISLPLQIGLMAATPDTQTRLDIVGVGVWMIGFAFETVGDWQLTRFKADSKNSGTVMDRGLWNYSRHPNYFGEFLVWWGFFLLALPTPFGGWTVVSPLIVTAVLLKMTGIPLTESNLVKTRPGYQEYVKRTNAFIPWFPRKESP